MLPSRRSQSLKRAKPKLGEKVPGAGRYRHITAQQTDKRLDVRERPESIYPDIVDLGHHTLPGKNHATA